MDACRNELKAQSATRNLDVAAVTVPRNVAALFSCSEEERAWENEKLRHGVFFHFVLQGLRGKAENGDGEVTWSRLSEYVRERVTKDIGSIVGENARQTPHEMGNVRGSSPVLVRGFTAYKNGIGMAFKRVPKPKGNKFVMGSPESDKERYDNEKEHEVTIGKDFYLGVYEVTQKQFKEVMGYNPSYFSKDGKKGDSGTYYAEPAGGAEKVKGVDTDDFPVENVSYEEAVKFCEKLNGLEKNRRSGWAYTLPTEAQWEYACRGGATSYKKYHFGDTITTKLANVGFHAKEEGSHDHTVKVGQYGANAFGLHDMHGNVWEWCRDWYDKDYQGADSAFQGSDRMIRGGGWREFGRDCRAAYRYGLSPSFRYWDLGFRVAAVRP
jgi:formylglycine-generating enzyme required for sulfatase activity